MASEVLVNAINGKLELEELLNWLNDSPVDDESFDRRFLCRRGDFVSYFLNLLHGVFSFSNGDVCSTTKARSRTGLQNDTEKADLKQCTSLDRSVHNMNISSNQSVSLLDKSVNNKYTPNKSVNSINSNASLSITSPISPIYNQNSYATPRNKKQLTPKQTCLGDFIVSSKKSSGKKKSSQKSLFNENAQRPRRINPTNLTQHNLCSSFRRDNNSFNFKDDAIELPLKTLSEQRNSLAEERHKIMSRRIVFESNTPIITTTSTPINKNKFLTNMKPDLGCVSYRLQLDCLVTIYASILNNNLALNMSSELYFLFSLMQLKCVKSQIEMEGDKNRTEVMDNKNRTEIMGDIEGQSELIEDVKSPIEIDGVNVLVNKLYVKEPKHLFSTIHNVVYFSANALKQLLNYLTILDRPTLRLLIDNETLKMFAPELVAKLCDIYDSKSERICEVNDGNTHLNVCFISDTDNRENFPSDPSFHAFRKQRDLFYEILRLWECSHLQPSWSYSVALGSKIKCLLNLHNDASNLMHLARLFKSQLLGTCSKSSSCEEGVPENQSSFLCSFPNVNIEKLNRLKSRLVTKHFSNGINPMPAFLGQQEFYKEFIGVASNHQFVKHLSDTLISEIVNLNDAQFYCAELGDVGHGVDVQTKKSYLSCLKRLRIMAKFLGYIESLPYTTENSNFPEKCLTAHLNARKSVRPNLDIKQLLLQSIKRQSLILTIPWLTKYLSMLDYVTLRLPYYESVFTVLFGLYRNCHQCIGCAENAYLIKLSLGWLFELPHFPEGQFFIHCTTADMKDSVVAFDHSAFDHKRIHLDQIGLVDQDVLYFCCNYLEELRRLLMVDNCRNESIIVKHITPLTAVQSSNEIAKKRLEVQLEEAFFNGQPVSIRNTVEFVCERTASTCVKHICSNVVPAFKKTALDDFKRYLDHISKDNLDHVEAKSNDFKMKATKQLEEVCNKEVGKIMSERLSAAIGSLLSFDVLPQTKEACVSIAVKMCSERVNQWINTHVVSAIFNKDFDGAIQALTNDTKKKDKKVFMLPPNGRDIDHDSDTSSAVHLIENIRGCCWDVLESKSKVTDKRVNDVLDEAKATITRRCDVNDCILNVINSLLVDFFLLLMAHKTALIDDGLILRFVDVWKCGYDKTSDEPFRSLVCPRNIAMLAQSNDVSLAWRKFAKFTSLLLNRGHVSCGDFESQCVSIFNKTEWDRGTLRRLSDCFRTVVECACAETTGDSFPFLSEFCKNL